MKLVPNEALCTVRKDDYRAMREMFAGDPLSFDEILERLKTHETRINSTAKK